MRKMINSGEGARFRIILWRIASGFMVQTLKRYLLRVQLINENFLQVARHLNIYMSAHRTEDLVQKLLEM